MHPGFPSRGCLTHLVYYFSTFPTLTTTFAQHQVHATEKLGLSFILAANRPSASHGFHPQDEDLRSASSVNPLISLVGRGLEPSTY